MTHCIPFNSRACIRATCHSLLISWILSLLASSGLAQTTSPSPPQHEPVARVGETALTRLDIDATLQETFDPISAPDLNASQTLRIATLTALVRRELALQRLLELGGEPLAARIQRKQTQLHQSLLTSNPDAELTESQLRSIAWQFAWNEYLEQHLNEANLKRFFETQRWQYAGGRAEIAQIFVPHATATPVDSEKPSDAETPSGDGLLAELQTQIQSGKVSFYDAAKKYSQSPSAAAGGEMGWIEASGDVPTPVAAAAFTGDLKTPLGPIRSTLGWHLIEVRNREEGTRTFEQIEDMAALRKAASDFLFNRLVATAAKNITVQWLDDSLQPPDSWRSATP